MVTHSACPGTRTCTRTGAHNTHGTAARVTSTRLWQLDVSCGGPHQHGVQQGRVLLLNEKRRRRRRVHHCHTIPVASCFVHGVTLSLLLLPFTPDAPQHGRHVTGRVASLPGTQRWRIPSAIVPPRLHLGARHGRPGALLRCSNALPQCLLLCVLVFHIIQRQPLHICPTQPHT